MRLRRGMILVAIGLFSCPTSNAVLPARPTAGSSPDIAGAKGSAPARALLVGVAEVAPGSGWWRLHADRDVELMREALARHGFTPEHVAVLRDRQATAAGIVAAFERELLAPARPGDVAVFYYSGHGQRLTDDDGDEVDGYDEALAPYGSPRAPAAAYRGERHLRDDQLGLLLARLRSRLGAKGSVLVILDSCFSGTATRGELPVRGAAAIGPPRTASARGGDIASGMRELGAAGAGTERLAPLVVLSASRFDELAYEIATSDRGAVGALTWAVAKSLLTPGLTLSYRGLLDDVRRELGSRFVPQEAQAEGDLDTELFSGRAIRQEPFVGVHDVVSGGRRFIVRPGEILGLSVGSEVEVHRGGALGPEAASRLALGRVVESTPTLAEVELDRAVAENVLRSARVFITARDFGDLRLRVRFVGPMSRVLEKALGEVAAIERVERKADLEVVFASTARGNPGVASITDVTTGVRLVGPGELPSENLTIALPQRLEDLARNRYLRQLRLMDSEYPIGFELVPVKCGAEDRPTSLETCEVLPLARDRFLAEGGQFELPAKTYFQVRIFSGPRPSHVAVLGLVSNGRIEVLWPMAGAEEPLVSRDRSPRILPALFCAAEPLGLDAVLVIASGEFLDFQPLRSGSEIEPRAPLTLRGPFSLLFDDERIRNRGRAAFAPRSVTTALETVRIVPARP